ncbi:MAG: transposase [bacterium]|nr:transposase [bacterium]
MPYRKEQFINDGIYHVILRGIDDNKLFKDTNDYYRGIFSIYEFNTINPVEILKRRRDRSRMKAYLKKTESLGGDPTSAQTDLRDKLVEIIAFCLMPNHIHLLIRQIKDGGIVKFMKKFGGGYARYFNLKHGRKGYVFQNRFLSVLIKTDEQLKIVFAYIHANSVSLIEPKWKERGIRDIKKAIKFAKEYKWSSFSDYLGKPNFPSVTDREFMLETTGGERACEKFIEDYIKYKGKFKEYYELFLE